MPAESHWTEILVAVIFAALLLVVILMVMSYGGIRSNLLGSMPILVRISEVILTLLGIKKAI